jgi:hypothetical protein
LDTWHDTGRSESFPTTPRTPTLISAGIGHAYEWFLELSVVIVLVVLWMAGVALVGSFTLVLYWVGRVLVGLIVGAI